VYDSNSNPTSLSGSGLYPTPNLFPAYPYSNDKGVSIDTRQDIYDDLDRYLYTSFCVTYIYIYMYVYLHIYIYYIKCIYIICIYTYKHIYINLKVYIHLVCILRQLTVDESESYPPNPLPLNPLTLTPTP
jgi:hypothetical protein